MNDQRKLHLYLDAACSIIEKSYVHHSTIDGPRTEIRLSPALWAQLRAYNAVISELKERLPGYEYWKRRV